MKVGKGGKSGASLFESTLKILRYVRKSHPEIVIMCSGGISTPEQARLLLNEGANALQIYTSLVYRGPGIIKELNDIGIDEFTPLFLKSFVLGKKNRFSFFSRTDKWNNRI